MERTRSLLTGQLFQWNGKVGNADLLARQENACVQQIDELGNKEKNKKLVVGASLVWVHVQFRQQQTPRRLIECQTFEQPG